MQIRRNNQVQRLSKQKTINNINRCLMLYCAGISTDFGGIHNKKKKQWHPCLKLNLATLNKNGPNRLKSAHSTASCSPNFKIQSQVGESSFNVSKKLMYEKHINQKSLLITKKSRETNKQNMGYLFENKQSIHVYNKNITINLKTRTQGGQFVKDDATKRYSQINFDMQIGKNNQSSRANSIKHSMHQNRSNKDERPNNKKIISRPETSIQNYRRSKKADKKMTITKESFRKVPLFPFSKKPQIQYGAWDVDCFQNSQF